MSSYKLYYFNARSYAELIRFVFAQAGVRYEDVRLSVEEWSKLKPDSPWGMMPILEIDGKKKLGGSAVIARFLSERFGLAGSDDVENAEIAAAMDAITSLSIEAAEVMVEKDIKKKAAQNNDFEKILQVKLQYFENLIAKSTAPEGWMFNKVTYADFALSMLIGGLIVHVDVAAVVARFPKVLALQQEVEKLPNIKAWLHRRPFTEY